MTTPYAALDAWIDAHFDEQVRFLQELHEDEVPHLDTAVAILVR